MEGDLKEGEKDVGLEWIHIDRLAWGPHKYSYLLTITWGAGL